MSQVARESQRMKRVRQLTGGMGILTAVFCVYWSFNILRFIGPFVFGSGMQDGSWVDEGVVISLGQKAAYFILWLAVVGSAWVTFYAAFRLLLGLRTGAFFAVETCRRLQLFGGALVVTFLCNTVLAAVQFSILTWNNPIGGNTGFVAPGYHFNSTNITVILCGLGFFAIGWIFYEGAQIEAENKGFI